MHQREDGTHQRGESTHQREEGTHQRGESTHQREEGMHQREETYTLHHCPPWHAPCLLCLSPYLEVCLWVERGVEAAVGCGMKVESKSSLSRTSVMIWEGGRGRGEMKECGS